MPKQRDQRVGVFVDIQNMYYSAKQFYNQKVNFAYILNRAVGGRKLIRAIAYVIKADIKEEENFFDALEKIGYDVRSKDLQTFYGGAKKGDWDVGIAMDIMRMAHKLDVIVLVSGDGDFKDLLEHVKALGCRAEVIAFRKTASSRILGETDEFMDLDKELDKVLIKDNRQHNKPREEFPNKDGFQKREEFQNKEGFQKRDDLKREEFPKREGFVKREEFQKRDGFQKRDNFQMREPFQKRDEHFERRDNNDPVSLIQKLNMDQPLLARPAREPLKFPVHSEKPKESSHSHEKPAENLAPPQKEQPKEEKKEDIKKKSKKDKQDSMLKKVISKVTRKKEK